MEDTASGWVGDTLPAAVSLSISKRDLEFISGTECRQNAAKIEWSVQSAVCSQVRKHIWQSLKWPNIEINEEGQSQGRIEQLSRTATEPNLSLYAVRVKFFILIRFLSHDRVWKVLEPNEKQTQLPDWGTFDTGRQTPSL